MTPKKLDKDAIAEGRIVLFSAREELIRADAKAALLLAAVGIVTGTLVAALLADNWSPQNLKENTRYLWWFGSLLGVIGIIALAYSVYPRTKYRGKRPPSMISYFGDVVRTPVEDLEKLLAETGKKSGSSMFDQLKEISAIVDKKYRGIQIGMWGIGASAILCTLAVLVDNIK